MSRPDATTYFAAARLEAGANWHESSRAVPALDSANRPIAGTSRPHDTLLQLGGRFVERPGCASEARCCSKTAFALLVVGLLGMFGVYRVGDFAHIFLLVGLMLLLLAVLKAREAALRRPAFRNND